MNRSSTFSTTGLLPGTLVWQAIMPQERPLDKSGEFYLGSFGDITIGRDTSTAVPAPVTIKLLNPPKKGLLELAVGESYTFDIEVTSSEPFIQTIVLGDKY